MPGTSGLEALKLIKSDERLKIIPVVIFTPSSEASDVAECYKQGANAYVIKPFDFPKFMKVVNHLCTFLRPSTSQWLIGKTVFQVDPEIKRKLLSKL